MTTRIKKIKVGATICEMESLLFKVDIIDNPRVTNKEYCKVVTATIEKNNAEGIVELVEMDLNYCSDIYALIKNEEIFPKIEQVLFNNAIDFTVEYSHINNVCFYADFTITDTRFGYTMKGTNDVIKPMIRVQHSYNGLTKYKIIFGYFRLVCSNGMTIAVQEMNEFNLSIEGKHTDSVIRSFAKLDSILKHFAANAQTITMAITARYEQLGGSWVENIEDRITEVLGHAKINIVENNKFNTMNDIVNRIMAEANLPNLGYNGRVNDFLIYNGINAYLNDDSLNIAPPETRREKDSKVLERMLATI